MDISEGVSPETKERRSKKAGLVAAILLATVAALIGFTGAANGSADEHDTGKPMTDIYRYETTDGPVRAEQLWAGNLSAMQCFEKDGFGAVGPFPSADGSDVQFFVKVPKCRENALPQPDHPCYQALTPLTMRFAMDDVAREKAKLVDLRADLEACVIAAGVTIDDRPQSAADGSPANPDAGLQEASQERPAIMRSCAADLVP